MTGSQGRLSAEAATFVGVDADFASLMSRQPAAEVQDRPLESAHTGDHQMFEPVPHRLAAGRSRPAEGGVAPGEKSSCSRCMARPARGSFAPAADHFCVHGVDLAVEIGKLRIGADRLFHRPPRGRAIEARFVVDRHHRANALDLQRQRLVVGFARPCVPGSSLIAAPKSASALGRSPFLRTVRPAHCETSATSDRAAAPCHSRRWRGRSLPCGRRRRRARSAP